MTIALLGHGANDNPIIGWPSANVNLPEQQRGPLEVARNLLDVNVLDSLGLQSILARHQQFDYNLIVSSCYSGRWIGADDGISGVTVTDATADQSSPFGENGGVDNFVKDMVSGLRVWRKNRRRRRRQARGDRPAGQFDRPLRNRPAGCAQPARPAR